MTLEVEGVTAMIEKMDVNEVILALFERSPGGVGDAWA